MSLLKRESNHVGRPSNEELKQKRNKKIIIGVVAVVVLGIISGGVYLLVSGTNLFGLMGNSVTKSVKVCSNGYKYSKKPEGCRQPNTYNMMPLKNLKVSSSSYKVEAIIEYISAGVSEFSLLTDSEIKNGRKIINKNYSDSLSVELYEIKNGKYKKIATVPFGSYKTVSIKFNESKTYTSRLVITDAVTGKKVYAPYSNKVTLSANKIYVKPELQVVHSEYKNGYYETDIAIKPDKVTINELDSDFENPKFKFELYEVVNGKNVYVGKASVFNQGVIVKIRPRAKKQYKARFVFDFGSKKIYSNYSNILKVSK